MSISITPYLERLETLLDEGLAASGDSFADKVSSVAADLPKDLHQCLGQIVESIPTADGAADSREDLCELIFRCGEACGRLQDYRQRRAQSSSVLAEADADVEPAELDAITRFLAVRDRLFRVVADFTLKVLLILFGLAVVGFVVGLI